MHGTYNQSAAWFQQGSDNMSPPAYVRHPCKGTLRGVHNVEAFLYRLMGRQNIQAHVVDVEACSVGNAACNLQGFFGKIKANQTVRPQACQSYSVGADMALKVDDVAAPDASALQVDPSV